MTNYGDHTDFRILKFTVKIEGRDDEITVPIYGAEEILMAIPEGTKYQSTIHFLALKSLKNFVYTQAAVKAGITVKKTVTELGDFEPREEPYSIEFKEDQTPSGFFFRGKCPVKSTYTLDGEVVLENSWTVEVTK
ncbi:hypothetical protein CLIB1444_04S10198 [[Candida] jaroonii]|uniref:Uncharacterized protein n=1 Tax=[Candida] jaroonii TaxID=467808 RepID=A0ACA9Y7C4_9ASCO|nr:hypothetical protein CLIB1444_04S10198 [[Candida] jaroonii]